MSRSTRSRLGFATLCAGLTGLVIALAMLPGGVLEAQRGPTPATGFITGIVQGASGPEAGVWVIAETKDLPTNFIKIVVTGNDGRFTVPELPAASYSVWVRGYGLADSTPTVMKPSATAVTLRANPAKTPQEAAKVYPADYWLAMLEPPAKSEFPGTGPQGNGIGPGMQTQNHFINSLKSDCNFCHQLGNQLTRSVDHVFKAKPELKTHAEAWEWRLGTGVRGNGMYGVLNSQGQTRALKMYADWTERVAKGEVPPAPPRPSGIERNVVVTLWDWATDKSYMHDEVATDKNRPTVNANGPIYGVSSGHGTLVMLDPKTNTAEEIEIPTRDPREKVTSRFPAPNRPSLFWGTEHLWANPPYNPADPHNPMLDSKGRVWLTSKIRMAAAGLVQRSREQVRLVVPAGAQRTPGVVLGSEDEAVHADRHLLFDAPPAVRQRCERDRLFQRALRADRRLDRHQGLRRDEGRAEGGRLVRSGHRHQRRRQDHASAMEPDHRPR